MSIAQGTTLMPLNTSGPLANLSGKLPKRASQHADQSGNDDRRKRDEAVAVLEAILLERDLIISRHETTMRNRTRQLDVLCEELARVASLLSEQQASDQDRSRRLEDLEQALAKYKTWLSGYDANLIYLEEQITHRDLTIQELQTKVVRLSEAVNQLAAANVATTTE